MKINLLPQICTIVLLICLWVVLLNLIEVKDQLRGCMVELGNITYGNRQ